MTLCQKLGWPILGSRWIAGRLLYPGGTDDPVFDLTPVRRVEATGLATIAGVTLTLDEALRALSSIDNYGESTLAVLAFPLILVAGVALFRLAQMLGVALPKMSQSVLEEAKTSEQGFAQLVARMVLHAVLVATVIGIVLGAVGYMPAAKGIIYPIVRSLALIALLAVLSRLATDLYAFVARQKEGARDALIPVLLIFALVLASLPFFALIWGTREDQLWEIWARMREGVSWGGVNISVTDFLTFIVVFAVGIGFTRLIKAALTSAVLPKTQLDKGGQNALVAGVGYIGVFLSGIAAITAAGIDLSALAIVAGALSVGDRFRSSKYRSKLCLGHHPLDRTADFRGRLDRGRRSNGVCARYLGALNPGRNL